MTAVLRAEEPSARYLVQVEPALVRGFELLATAPGGIAKLRELVLAMAVRGKLTSPQTGDSSVDRLLAEIAGRREQRVASGEMRADRPAPRPIDEEMPFDLPKHWQWVRLAQLGQIVGGGTPKSDDASMWSPAGIPWLTPADLYRLREKAIGRGRRDISDKGLGESSARVLPAGTVLFSSRAPIGYVAIAANALATNQGFKSCVPHVPQLADYLYWYLKHAAQGIDAAASGTTFKEVSGAEFARVLVPLPPLAEQHRIVARVEELMKLCDALEQNGRLADEQHARLTSTLFDALAVSESAHALAENWQRVAEHFDLLLDRPEAIDTFEQTIFGLAVHGLLVPQEPMEGTAFESLKRIATWKQRAVLQKEIREPRKPLAEVESSEPPYVLPASWAWARLGELIYIRSGDGLTAANMKSGGIPVYGGNGVNGHHDKSNVETPTLVVGRVGFYCGSVHITPPRAWVTDNAFITKFCADAIDMQFLALLLTATNLKEDEGATAQPVISGTKIYPIVVGLPPFAEQHRIVARVEELHSLCAEFRQRLTKARETQSRLADALVSESVR